MQSLQAQIFTRFPQEAYALDAHRGEQLIKTQGKM
jgi:hypothetical protein